MLNAYFHIQSLVWSGTLLWGTVRISQAWLKLCTVHSWIWNQGNTKIIFVLLAYAIPYHSVVLKLVSALLLSRKEVEHTEHTEEMFLIEFALAQSELLLILNNMKIWNQNMFMMNVPQKWGLEIYFVLLNWKLTVCLTWWCLKKNKT